MSTKPGAAVVYISGQSNAHAHAQALPESEWIKEPLKNVFALDRNPNQTFKDVPAVWSNFTGEGKNLGETQDNTACFAYYFAKRWQAAIDAGSNLPDLYIVQLSIGSQGIITGMWNKHKYIGKKLVSGSLSTVKIALYPLAERVYRAVHRDLTERFENPVAIGWHWLGSEQDRTDFNKRPKFCKKRYDDFFNTMLTAIGFNCPLYLYKLMFPCSDEVMRGIGKINAEFDCQAKIHGGYVVQADASPLWNAETDDRGVFSSDNIHYRAETQKWFADRFFDEIMGQNSQFAN